MRSRSRSRRRGNSRWRQLGWQRSRSSIVGKGSNILLILNQNSNRLVHRNILCTRLYKDLSQEAFVLALEVHLRLVSLDLNEHIARLDGVTDLLVPRANVAGCHCWRQSRHVDDGVGGQLRRRVSSGAAGGGATGSRSEAIEMGTPPATHTTCHSPTAQTHSRSHASNHPDNATHSQQRRRRGGGGARGVAKRIRAEHLNLIAGKVSVSKSRS